jgi:Family of unknown function (DUF5681)
VRRPPSRRNRREYEVGWGKPPKSERWKPGQSGNPKGRPRAKKNQLTMFSEALEQRIQIEERGVKRSVTVLEAVIKRFTTLALRGDLKAIKLLLDIKAGLPEPPSPLHRTDDMSPEELQRLYLSMVTRVG